MKGPDDFQEVAELRNERLGLVPQVLQNLHDVLLRVKRLEPVLFGEGDSSHIHILLGEKHLGITGFNQVCDRVQGFQHRVHGVDQILLGDRQGRHVVRLGLARQGEHIALLFFALAHIGTRELGAHSQALHSHKGPGIRSVFRKQFLGIGQRCNGRLLVSAGLAGLVVLQQGHGLAHGLQGLGDPRRHRERVFCGYHGPLDPVGEHTVKFLDSVSQEGLLVGQVSGRSTGGRSVIRLFLETELTLG